MCKIKKVQSCAYFVFWRKPFQINQFLVLSECTHVESYRQLRWERDGIRLAGRYPRTAHRNPTYKHTCSLFISTKLYGLTHKSQSRDRSERRFHATLTYCPPRACDCKQTRYSTRGLQKVTTCSRLSDFPYIILRGPQTWPALL